MKLDHRHFVIGHVMGQRLTDIHDEVPIRDVTELDRMTKLVEKHQPDRCWVLETVDHPDFIAGFKMVFGFRLQLAPDVGSYLYPFPWSGIVHNRETIGDDANIIFKNSEKPPFL